MYTETVDTFTRGSFHGQANGVHEAKVSPKLIKVLSAKPAAEDPALLSAIDRSRITLTAAIRQAATSSAPGFPIRAALELSGDKSQLNLSVYTAKNAKAAPETNPVTESAGDPTAAKWQPITRAFGGAKGKLADFARVARAAAMLSRMQRTRLSLYDVIRKASEYGTVYSVEPVTMARRTMFNVLVKDAAGKAQQLLIDLRITAN